MVSDGTTLPAFLDRRACHELVGMTRVDVDRLFQRCTVYALDGSRKVYVNTGDVLATLQAFPPGSIRRTWANHAA